MVRKLGRRRPFTNCARSPEWNSTVSRIRGSSRLVRTKVGLSPYPQPNPRASKPSASLVGSRSHDIAVDRLEERLDEYGIRRFSAGEFVRGLQPVDPPVVPCDEAVETRLHMDGDAGISVCQGNPLCRTTRVGGHGPAANRPGRRMRHRRAWTAWIQPRMKTPMMYIGLD